MGKVLAGLLVLIVGLASGAAHAQGDDGRDHADGSGTIVVTSDPTHVGAMIEFHASSTPNGKNVIGYATYSVGGAIVWTGGINCLVLNGPEMTVGGLDQGSHHFAIRAVDTGVADVAQADPIELIEGSVAGDCGDTEFATAPQEAGHGAVTVFAA
jgi:hypothetical protein